MNSGKTASYSVQLMQILDGFLIWCAFWLAQILRQPMRDLLGHGEVQGVVLNDLTLLIFLIIILAPVALEAFGFYHDVLYRKFFRSLWMMMQAGVVVLVVVALLVIFLKVDVASRWIMGGAAAISMVLIMARFYAMRWLVRAMVREEDAKEAVVLVGIDGDREEFLSEMSEEFHLQTKVVSEVNAQEKEIGEGMGELLEQQIKEHAVGKVIFAARGMDFRVLSGLVEVCELLGVEAWVMADFMRTGVARPSFDTLGGKGMLVMRSTPELSWSLIFKGMMDVVGASVILILTLPLWLVAAVGIIITSPKGKIIFMQERAGRYGKPFRVWKFRTMHPDAERQLDQVKAEVGNEMDGPVFKLQKDPRVFKFGSFLRRTSIDELPQLVNVLKGEMSLVGPRPLPMYEVVNFSKAAHRRRLSVKPGITCTWQAGGRNEISSFEEWVKLDLDYIDHWSLWLDIKILFKTVPAVLFSRGAK